MLAHNVYLFIFDSMADWEASFAIAAIHNPRFQRNPGRYRVVSVGITREPVTTMGGVRILPDLSLSEVETSDAAMLILPGGDAWESGANSAAVDLARVFFIEGIPVAAISAATLALACAGMLDDFHHTSDSRDYLAATAYRGGKFYCDAPAVRDEGLITASGTAPLEFAREIFKVLDLYSGPALDAWYSLFKFGSPSRYHELIHSAA